MDTPPKALRCQYACFVRSRHAARFCVSCDEVYGHICAITEPPCPNNHEDGRLTCAENGPDEDELRSYMEKAGWHAKRRAAAAEEDTFEASTRIGVCVAPVAV